MTGLLAIRVRTLAVALVVGLTVGLNSGCGGDSGAGPMAPAGPSTPQIGGVWTYSASNVAGGGASCTVTNLRLTLVPTGTTFTGTYSGGSMVCSGNGQTVTLGPFQGTVANGTLNGTGVSFDLDTQDWRSTGSVNGSSMSGQVTVRVDLGQGAITLKGNWSAAR